VVAAQQAVNVAKQPAGVVKDQAAPCEPPFLFLSL